jgi:hypothetical protein
MNRAVILLIDKDLQKTFEHKIRSVVVSAPGDMEISNREPQANRGLRGPRAGKKRRRTGDNKNAPKSSQSTCLLFP